MGKRKGKTRRKKAKRKSGPKKDHRRRGAKAGTSKQRSTSSAEALPFLNPRALEGTMFDLFGRGKGSALDRAQDMMYKAWDTPNRRGRVELALGALEVSRDCADAFVLLAEEAAPSLTDALELYQGGVEAGERALGKEVFEEQVGHFWGLLETRPYMRARAGLARCLWEAGEREQAVAHYNDLLRLNPGDNQGIRYVLAACLLELGRDEELARLLEEYEDDATAAWAYTAALLAFRSQGESEGARRALTLALEANKNVPPYLTGKKKLPPRLPDFAGFGDENEAICYAADNKRAWQATTGALAWLAANVQ
ncbi:MAG: hypothetical protein ACE5JI_04475 [Acidobacteriota bacterium]